MMLVVADTSPLIVLGTTGDLNVLPSLFGDVLVPPEVMAELARPDRTSVIQLLAASPPAWLRVRAPSQQQRIPGLHGGETAAIALAAELNASAILIDEYKGRRAAASRGLLVMGTIGVLELAAGEGLVDLAQAFERVKATDFRVSHRLLDHRLGLFRDRKEGQ